MSRWSRVCNKMVSVSDRIQTCVWLMQLFMYFRRTLVGEDRDPSPLAFVIGCAHIRAPHYLRGLVSKEAAMTLTLISFLALVATASPLELLLGAALVALFTWKPTLAVRAAVLTLALEGGLMLSLL